MTRRFAFIVVTSLGLGTAVAGHLSPSGRQAPCDRQRFGLGHSTTDVVNVFRGASEDSTALRSLTGDNTGLCLPTDVAVDHQGRLYVLNGHLITVYQRSASGDAAPIREIRLPAGMNIARGFGLDRRGNLYVGTDESPPPDSGSITVYPRGAVGAAVPRRILIGSGTGLRRPVGIALGEDGGVYASTAGDTVLMFAPGAAGDTPPVRVLAGAATGLKRPSGLAVDRRGNLYVANTGKNTVTVYSPGAAGDVPPVRTIEGGAKRPWLGRPVSLALDSDDTLYVATEGSVNVYAPDAEGKVAPVRWIRANYPNGIAVGRDRTLYLAQGGKVLAFAPGAADSAVPTRTFEGDSGRRDAYGVALGNGDTLYVTDQRNNAVTVYPPGSTGTATRRVLSGLNTRLSTPLGVTVDGKGNVYVANGPQPKTPGAIRVYDPTATGDASPVRLFAGRASPLNELADIGIDSRGDMYVLGIDGRVTVYRPGTDSNPAPIRTLTGPNTFLRQPIRLAFGRNDTLYVLNAFHLWKYGTDNVTVTVYAPRAEGDTEPLRSIVVARPRRSKGSKLGLRWPTSIAVDSRGSVYVSNYFSAGVVAVYPPGAADDVQPVRLLRPRGADTASAWPRLGPVAVAVGPKDEIFVASSPQPMMFTLAPSTRARKRGAIAGSLPCAPLACLAYQR